VPGKSLDPPEDLPDEGPAGLEEPLLQARQGPALNGQGQSEPAQEIAQIVGDDAQEQPHLIGPEAVAAGTCPERIALVHLDTDYYQSTKHELIHLCARLVQGGVLIIDDYGHFERCRQATDEYFAEYKPKFLLSRIDYSGRSGVKL
jgi:hypothetical protein